MLAAALFFIAQHWIQSKYSSLSKWHSQTEKYCSTIKSNDAYRTVIERSRCQKTTYCESIYKTFLKLQMWRRIYQGLIGAGWGVGVELWVSNLWDNGTNLYPDCRYAYINIHTHDNSDAGSNQLYWILNQTKSTIISVHIIFYINLKTLVT